MRRDSLPEAKGGPSALRASNASLPEPDRFMRFLGLMGHYPFQWPTPDGYPDSLTVWGTTLLPRWQYTTALFDGQFPDVTIDTQALIESEGDVPGEQAAAINRILTGGSFSDQEVAVLQQFYDDASSTFSSALSETFGLAASMPGFQWY